MRCIPWTNIIGAIGVENISDRVNRTVDVLHKNCFTDWDTVACVRSSALCFMSAMTAMLCVGRIVRLHLSRHPDFYQYAIFYLAVFQCLMGTVEWVFGWTAEASLVCLFLRILQALVIAYFYTTVACRILRWTEAMKRIPVGFLTALFVYFTVFVCMGFAERYDSWCNCSALNWVLLTGGHVTVVQLLAVSAAVIVNKIDSVSSADSLKNSQKRDLRFLVIVLEISAALGLAYHLSMFILVDAEEGCSGIFRHEQAIYSSFKVPYEIFLSLLPIWTLLFVFKPLERALEEDREKLVGSEAVEPADQNSPQMRVRRPLHTRLLQPGAWAPLRLPSLRRVSRRRRRLARRASSCPAITDRARLPILAPIPEESGVSSSSAGSSAVGSVAGSPPEK